jgi:hypothetical protein
MSASAPIAPVWLRKPGLKDSRPPYQPLTVFCSRLGSRSKAFKCRLQSAQEGHQIFLFLGRKADIEALIVKLHRVAK